MEIETVLDLGIEKRSRTDGTLVNVRANTRLTD